MATRLIELAEVEVGLNFEGAGQYSNPILFLAKILLLFREKGTGNRE